VAPAVSVLIAFHQMVWRLLPGKRLAYDNIPHTGDEDATITSFSQTPRKGSEESTTTRSYQ